MTYKELTFAGRGGDGEIKLSLFAGMVGYVENPNDSTQKTAELTNGFSTGAGYKNQHPKSNSVSAMKNLKRKIRKQFHLQ